MSNESGIYPSGNRVLVYADQIDEKIKDSVIELIEQTKAAMQSANASGTLVASGPDAFQHTTQITERLIDGQWKQVERVRSGYSEAFALPGDRISFAKYAGQRYEGKDGKQYLVINDEDITCQLHPEVELSDLKIRERV
jgi:co-chaperonin GroES (HSP10)